MKKLAEVEAQLVTVRQMHNSGQLSDDLFHKCLVSAAYEFILAGEQEKGLRLINEPPTSYYRDVQLAQMREDQMYAQLVVVLGYKLMQMGLVEVDGDVLAPNMDPASA